MTFPAGRAVLAGLLVLLLGGAVSCLAAVEAAAPPSRPIGEILRARNAENLPTAIGETVTVTGVITRVIGLDAVHDDRFVNVQDGTGGLRLLARPARLLEGFERGDLVRATGQLYHWKGNETIRLSSITRIGNAPQPAPRDVRVRDLLGEQFSGQLVRVTGELRLGQEFNRRRGAIRVRDGSGEIIVTIPPALGSRTEFLRQLTNGGRVRLDGLLEQQKETPPFDSGYRLVTREENDWRFVPTPPYFLWAGGAAGAAMLAAGAGLVARQRRAERYARETTELLRQVEASREALAASEARYRQLFEGNPEPAWVYDRDTLRILAANEAAVQHYGYSREELERLTMRDLLSPEQLARFQAGEAAAGTPLEADEPWVLRRRDGTPLEVELTAHDVRFDGRAGRLVLAQDVTPRRRLEEQLRHSQKMESVGRLAGGVAHDFNNMLVVINGYSRLLLDDPNLTPKARRSLTHIRTAGERAAALTQQLLAFGRRQMLQVERLDPNAAVRAMEPLLNSTLGEQVELVLDLSPDAGLVEADLTQLEQVLLNLVVNARDAMPPGGRVTVRTGRVDLRDRRLASQSGEWGLSTEAVSGPYVALTVSDTGEGMDEATLRRIFEPFFTTKEVGKGTGLGMATVYGIVRQSNGYIEVRSQPGQGTAVEVLLPWQGEAPFSSEPAAPREETPTRAGSGTVLLVEDEEMVRGLTASVLQEAGYQVLTAASGAEAVEMARDYPGRIDLLLTDVVMPDLNGPAAARAIAQHRGGIPTLYMTGYPEDDEARRDLAGDCLQKPFAPEELLRRVAGALGQRVG